MMTAHGSHRFLVVKAAVDPRLGRVVIAVDGNVESLIDVVGEMSDGPPVGNARQRRPRFGGKRRVAQ